MTTLLRVSPGTDYSSNGYGWAVGLAHVESLENNLVEGSICTPSQKPVQLKNSHTSTSLAVQKGVWYGITFTKSLK